jgi:hypothetical protein
MAEGERGEIPWEISITRPQLRLDQRLAALVEVKLDGGKLKPRGSGHDFVLLANVAPENGPGLPTPDGFIFQVS